MSDQPVDKEVTVGTNAPAEFRRFIVVVRDRARPEREGKQS
jgi:hypothetical protein